MPTIIKTAFFLSLWFCFGVLQTAQANVCLDINLPDTDLYEFQSDISITADDGVQLSANMFVPKTDMPPAGYPTIVFVNSWALEEHEYLSQARYFAENGYIVLTYSTRGWGCSGGMANVFGPKDKQDISRVIDYLEDYTQADMANVGFGGISYGGGMSLMAASFDDRVKTVVAMSTPTSIVESLYGNETLRFVWSQILLLSGEFLGTMDPEIRQNYESLRDQTDIPGTTAWGLERSPETFIANLNQRNVPVYIANSFGDNLFQPNQVLRYFETLTGPKKLDLNQGTHASAEAFGLFGLDNYTWKNARRWFDYWLKGANNGIMNEPAVSMLIDGKTTRDYFSSYPFANVNSNKLYLHPRLLLGNGKLKSSQHRPWFGNIKDTIISGLDSGASTGIPALSEVLSAELKLPIYKSLVLLNRIHGVTYQTGFLRRSMKIRGIPEIDVNLKSNASSMHLNAYLYDVDALGIGRLITHGTVTVRGNALSLAAKVKFDMVAAAYDVPPGHRVAVVFDTFDLLYQPTQGELYSVEFRFPRGGTSSLTLPVKN